MTPLDLESHLLQHGHALRGLAQDLVRDHHVADDLVQATLVCALDKPPAAPGPVGGWLTTVLRRLHLQRHRQERRREQRERRVAPSEPLPSTIDQVERRETLKAVTTAVFALEEPYQTTLLLRYFENLMPAEIALRTATGTATVKSRLQRGLLLLRGRLDTTLGDRRQWRRALCAATGLRLLVTTTTLLGTGLLMGTTTKLALGGATALLLGAVAWTLLDTEPLPTPPPAAASEVASPATATAAIDASKQGGMDRVALPDAAPDYTALLHPFAFELEVQVQDRLGLPVEGVQVLLAPFGCRLDEVPARTDDNGVVRIQWRGRSASMPMVVAARSDETNDAMRQVVVTSGISPRVVFGGSSARGTTVRLFRSAEGKADAGSFEVAWAQPTAGKWLAAQLDSRIVLQQGIFADNPRMHEGLHPFASFGDVQWRQPEQTAAERFSSARVAFSISSLGTLVVDTSATEANEAKQLAARIEGIVYGEDGKPCAKCPVSWGTRVDRASERTKTDERGAFHFDNVPEGALELRAGGGDAGLQHTTVSTMHGQTATVDVHLRRQASVRGRAVAADGKPLAGWRIEWVGAQTPWFDACTVADDGSFVLPNLPGGSGHLLLWRGKGSNGLPVVQVGSVLLDNGEVELRFDTEVCNGKLQLEPALPDGVDQAAVEGRIFQEETGRGTTLHKEKDGNRFSLAGLAAGWYRVELGGPGLGWLDAGRHYVDGKSVVDLGRVAMPRAGTLRLHLPAGAQAQPAEGKGAFVVEIYHRRADCDVRIEDPALGSASGLPLQPGLYFAMWRAANGVEGLLPFTVQTGREVEVHCSNGDAGAWSTEVAEPAGERR